ncbi:MAG TPA: helix-turn-helix domain-containing protein, partial [Ktedonobacteraceae bacterium]|nr:helix-turn-helix domain-containing protein [Ktedonobacteraceae bacterium]
MPKVVDEQMREATRRRILHEAAREFARLGFDQTNIQTIAKQAQIGKGTIYLYFENKRDLFLSLLRAVAQDQMTAIHTALAARGSLQHRLERLFLAFAHFAEQESDSFQVFMSALYGVNRAFRDEAKTFLRDSVVAIALILMESQACGELHCEHVDTAALMTLSLTESYVLSAK